MVRKHPETGALPPLSSPRASRSPGRISGLVLGSTAGLMLAMGCEQKSETAAPPTAPVAQEAKASPKPKAYELDRSRLDVFAPLPDVISSPNNTITAAKTELGRMLYFDQRLSKNQDLSCDSCHSLQNYFGAEARPVSLGHKQQKGRRNAPSVFNAAGHFVQFWDGRSPSVEHQATQPLANPIEMASNDKLLVRTLSSIPGYVKAFKEVFPNDKQSVTLANFGIAIGAYERQLVTPSRWDKYLKGDDAALTDAEKRGVDKFLDVGCQACHSGAYVGGNSFQKAGMVKPWPNQADQGRFELTKQDADKMMFKVPSLRNIEKTAPYFHDGSEPDLHKAVLTMAEHQLGKKISDADVNDIVFFLQTLTGTVPAVLVEKPELPASGKTTPKPDAR